MQFEKIKNSVYGAISLCSLISFLYFGSSFALKLDEFNPNGFRFRRLSFPITLNNYYQELDLTKDQIKSKFFRMDFFPPYRKEYFADYESDGKVDYIDQSHLTTRVILMRDKHYDSFKEIFEEADDRMKLEKSKFKTHKFVRVIEDELR